jgi:site-specific recombinase XerD
MCTQKIEDQGTIPLSQMDYSPIVIDSFLVHRKAQGLSGETIQFYQKRLEYFSEFYESQAVTQVEQITPDLIERYLLQLRQIDHILWTNDT